LAVWANFMHNGSRCEEKNGFTVLITSSIAISDEVGERR